jgi:hypothetical protein
MSNPADKQLENSRARQAGRFENGRSGDPAGKPPGARKRSRPRCCSTDVEMRTIAAETEMMDSLASTDRAMRGSNRPSLYDPGMLDKVCDGLIAGESLTQLCKDPDMPSEASVYRAMAKDDEVARIIARAREWQQEAEIERTIAMADAATEADYNVVKLRIWARQWRASKLAPKKYGDKAEVQINQTLDVADRIIARWKENLVKLEIEEPRVIEGTVEP